MLGSPRSSLLAKDCPSLFGYSCWIQDSGRLARLLAAFRSSSGLGDCGVSAAGMALFSGADAGSEQVERNRVRAMSWRDFIWVK